MHKSPPINNTTRHTTLSCHVLISRIQPNCTEIARMYGQDASYNSIENFLRKPKRVAAQLKEEAAGREALSSSPSKKVTVKSSPAKKNDGGEFANSSLTWVGCVYVCSSSVGVKTGRVEKKTKPKKIKVEEVVVVDDGDSGNDDSEEDYV